VRESFIGGRGHTCTSDVNAVERVSSARFASWQKRNDSKHSMGSPSSEVMHPRKSRSKADISVSKFRGGVHKVSSSITRPRQPCSKMGSVRPPKGLSLPDLIRKTLSQQRAPIQITVVFRLRPKFCAWMPGVELVNDNRTEISI
jgi:hypothetical protein